MTALPPVCGRALREHNILCLNLISSPGSGKTSLLERTLESFDRRERVAVLTGDIQTENDAKRLARFGFPVKQITTGGTCHLDARMIERALLDWRLEDIDLLLIENVGNLVCPSSYDLGEAAKIVVLSVTEGEDKPLKYPSIFLQVGTADPEQDRPSALRAIRCRCCRSECAEYPPRYGHRSGVLPDARGNGGMALLAGSQAGKSRALRPPHLEASCKSARKSRSPESCKESDSGRTSIVSRLIATSAETSAIRRQESRSKFRARRSWSRISSRASRRMRRRWHRLPSVCVRETPCRPDRGFEIRSSHTGQHVSCADLSGRGNVRRLSSGAVRPSRPPVSLSFYQLHELRTALHDPARCSLRPAAHFDVWVPDVRAMPRGI